MWRTTKESDPVKNIYAFTFAIINSFTSLFISYGLLKRPDTFAVLLLLSVILFLLIGRRIKRIQLKELRHEQGRFFEKVEIKDKEKFYYPIIICYLTSIYTFLIYLFVDFILF